MNSFSRFFNLIPILSVFQYIFASYFNANKKFCITKAEQPDWLLGSDMTPHLRNNGLSKDQHNVILYFV